jgi:hypothetical protein
MNPESAKNSSIYRRKECQNQEGQKQFNEAMSRIGHLAMQIRKGRDSHDQPAQTEKVQTTR